MTEEVALKAVDLAAKNGERFIIQFTGGEPLLNFPVLQSVVKYVQEQKLPALLQIQTNASLMTKEIARFLYQNKIGIGVSLDGKPAINDKLRFLQGGGGASSAILAGIKVLQEEKIGIGITCVVTSQNVKELEGIIDIAYYLGNVRVLGFDILRSQGRGKNLLPPIPEEMYQAMERVYCRADTYENLTGIKLKIAQEHRICNLVAGDSKIFGHCYAMNGEAAFVNPAGKIFACSSFMDDEEFCIGSVFSGIEEDLQSMIAEKIKASMSECSSCENLSKCGGGCFARAVGEKRLSEAECAMQKVSIARVGGE